MALTNLLPSVQIHHNNKFFRGREGHIPGQKSRKLELRLLVPAHCCSGIIGKGGSVIKKIKEETASYVQVYTLPMPLSEEHCVRIQNFESADLITTAAKVFEAIAEIKGKNPITMYDPIWFEHGEHGDTGSYIDTKWYQQALRSGQAQPVTFKQLRNSGRGGHQAEYEEPYPAHDESYGAHEDPYGYEETYEAESFYPPAPRARGPPRGGPPRGGPTRGFGGQHRGGAPMRGFQPRGAPRGRSF